MEPATTSSSHPRSAFDVLMAPNSKIKQQRSSINRVTSCTNSQPHQQSSSSSNKRKFENIDDEASIEPKGQSKEDSAMDELKNKCSSFLVKKAAYWGKGESVPFMFVAKAMDAIFTRSSMKEEIVCNFLRTVMETTPQELIMVFYLLMIHRLEFGLRDPTIIKVLAEFYGRSEAQIKDQEKVLGDLGLVAKANRSSQPLMLKPLPLTVATVFNTFQRISEESGKDSLQKKKNHIKKLLFAATDCEPQYLIRMLQRNLRIGVAEQTILAALGHAAVYFDIDNNSSSSSSQKVVDNLLEEATKIVKQAYSVTPSCDKIVAAILSGGVRNVANTCTFSPGVPIATMEAHSIRKVSEIADKFQDMNYTCEYKYDGERAQIHYLENGTVEIFSKGALRNTDKFPDVVAAITRLKQPSVTNFVVDCELVAYDLEKHKILSFQTLRAREDIVMGNVKVNVCIYAFDILYLNGQQLLHEQLNVRREHLYKSFQQEVGYLQFATCTTSNDIAEIQKFLDDSVNASCEGLMIKTLSKNATYEPSKRKNNWLKLKKDYMDSIGDSLDLVPIAAFYGKGKRTGSYGTFLLACYDADNDEYQSICKLGNGFSRAELEEHSASLRSKVIDKPMSNFRYSNTISPDVWFPPTVVWEVKAADLTISPVYHAAIGTVDSAKGISLRFPRLVRVRDDKIPEQATTSDRVAYMYYAQKNQQDGKVGDE